MSKKAYTVTDLGPGDGGKGGVIHKLCVFRRPHTVIKVGGAQGSHGVATTHGRKFCFSQFGCGTFEGVHTFLSDRFVMSPIGVINEAEALRYEQGIHDPISMLDVDERVLCTTPYHGVVSRLRELALKENSRGIIGVGVGEAFMDSMQFPELALRVSDLRSPNLHAKLARVREQKLVETAEILAQGFLEGDAQEVKDQISFIRQDDIFEWIVDQFAELGRHLQVVSCDYLRDEILSRDGTVVVESSHGVLTDRCYGFSPHTTRLRTLPEITSWSLLRENDYDGNVVKLAVTRAYQIRHGAGPLVTEDREMTESLPSEETGPPNRYRGSVRIGSLDMVLLRYAIHACGGPEMFDGIAVTWFDSVFRMGSWKVSHEYEDGVHAPLFLSPREIRLWDESCGDQSRYQSELTRALFKCRPCVTEFLVLSDMARSDVLELCRDVLRESLGVPVRMIALGPTEKDKILF